MRRHAMQFFVRLGLIALLATEALAAKQYPGVREGFNAEFGISSVNRREGPQILVYVATPYIPQSAQYIDSRAMRAIGSVMFLGVAKPSKELSNVCPALRIDISQPTGRRLAVRFSQTKEVHGEIYDWELIPTVEYVRSGQDGLYSYMKYEAEYQKAFADNLVGRNLFLLDGSRNWEQFPYAHLFLPGPAIDGYPQKEPTDLGLETWKTLRSFLGSDQLMFFDRGVEFVFSADNERLSISGAPYWAAVEKNSADDNGRILRSFKNTAAARLTNPTIYDSAYRVSKYSAFFRYIARNCKTEWANFWADLEVNREAMIEIGVRPEEVWDRYLRLH